MTTPARDAQYQQLFPGRSRGKRGQNAKQAAGFPGATLVCKGGSACAIGDGLPDTGGLFRILTALATAAPAEQLLVLGVARSGSHAMAVLEVPADD